MIAKKLPKKALKPPLVHVSKPMEAVIIAAMEQQRLDKALTVILAGQMDAISRVRVQSFIDEGHVTLAGRVITTANHTVKPGETYIVMVPPPEAAAPEAQNIDLDIVHEDKDLLVVNKPPGMVVHPAPGNRDMTLVNALLAHCGASLSGVGGVARPGIVHRLDKDTSGLIVIAKNDLAHQGLTAQFADRSLSRTYYALVWGVPVPRTGSIDAPIGRHMRDRKKMAVSAKGKNALTHYTTLENFDIASLLECKLGTGRTHQIRVHLANRKCPVVGDQTYGQRKKNVKGEVVENKLREFPRQALHAAELQFIHPRTQKQMRFSADMPKDMKDLLKALRKKNSKA